MPAPFPPPTSGLPVNNPPTGFPAFFDKRQPRVLTADPWAFLLELVALRAERRHRDTGYSYVNQAWALFEAASNPHVGSRPLLYYYSFLNLVKAALLIRRAPPALKVEHGIADPRSNQRRQPRLGVQRVLIQGLARDHSQLFAEFVRLLGGTPRHREIPVTELLAQIPSIHRAFMRVTRRRRSLFTPLHEVAVLQADGQVWARAILRKDDRDVVATVTALRHRRGFRRHFTQVHAPQPEAIWLETSAVPGHRRGVDGAIQVAAGHFRDVGVSTVLTRDGYRFYFCNIPLRHWLPRLAATYAAFFYLGSISRYRPDAFDRLVSGGFSWIVHELIATEPVQFVYTLASELAGVDVVRPFAVT